MYIKLEVISYFILLTYVVLVNSLVPSDITQYVYAVGDKINMYIYIYIYIYV